jgi:membrane-bound lytic murein transglycosylase A
VSAHAEDAAAAPGRRLFSELAGWAGDDHGAALAAFRRGPLAGLAGPVQGVMDARSFFERHFTLGPTIPGRFTGYFEPELDASPVRTAAFPVPLHRLPPGGCALPRAGIDAHLKGRELVWLRDEVARFFAQVQGSARLRLPDGRTMRVGYAGRNGHHYISIGKRLVARGEFGADITADALAAWLRADPARGRAVMEENPSYVFFRALDTDPTDGPVTTLGCAASAGRTLAVDADLLPLGTPVWIEVDGFRRLCIAQDTGSAIRGPGRADLFFGSGAAAGAAAGRLNHGGGFTPFQPR